MGTSLELKRQYGVGYRLSVGVEKDRYDDVDRYVHEMFPRAIPDVVCPELVHYAITADDIDIGELFGKMKGDGVNMMFRGLILMCWYSSSKS